MSWLEVIDPGPYASVQDLGRAGLAALGVSPSGACDRASLRLANRLVGNDESAAAIETTAGGLAVRAHGAMAVAITGAPASAAVDHRSAATSTVIMLPDSAELRVGRPEVGLRNYVSVRGGLAVEPILGSRSTDLLSGIGPAPLRRGDRLPVGASRGPWTPVDVAPSGIRVDDPLELEVVVGPRDDWFVDGALDTLFSAEYEVGPDSNRVGLRLSGPALQHRTERELPSEGLARGALQVSHSGQPALLLADHPTTGGYPVLAVVRMRDLDAAGQARPGQRLRFRPARG